MARWHLEIDPIACDGHGLCADVYPEGIHLDDWGYPVLADADIPPHLEARARQAVRICPRVALRLKTTTPVAKPADLHHRLGLSPTPLTPLKA
jgi:ferredoxin